MVGLLLLANASAQLLDVVDGWNEYVSPYGCHLKADLDNGTTLVLNYIAHPPNGSAADLRTLRVTVSNNGWTSLVEGQTYPLTADFGRKRIFVQATYEEGQLAFLANRELVEDALFGKSYIEIAYQGAKIVSTGLSGPNVVYSVNQCLGRFNDPFRR